MRPRFQDIDQMVAWIRQRLGIQHGGEARERLVYLAETLIDSDERQGLAEELRSRNRGILPAGPYADATYAGEAAADLRVPGNPAWYQRSQPVSAGRPRVLGTIPANLVPVAAYQAVEAAQD